VITGAHTIIYSQNPEADRAFLRDVLKFPFVDVGHGWLIFGLPPAEVAVHPSEKNDVHEFYLMCDDVDALVADLTARGTECAIPSPRSQLRTSHPAFRTPHAAPRTVLQSPTFTDKAACAAANRATGTRYGEALT